MDKQPITGYHRSPPSTDEQRRVEAKLLGNPYLMQKLREIFEGYDFDADPYRRSENVIRLIAKEGGLTLP